MLHIVSNAKKRRWIECLNHKRCYSIGDKALDSGIEGELRYQIGKSTIYPSHEDIRRVQVFERYPIMTRANCVNRKT